MSQYQIFSDRLKELRHSLGLNQREFSESIACTQATLSAYENAPKNPSLDIIKLIAEKYCVSIDWLCGLSDKKNNNTSYQHLSDLIQQLALIEDATPFKVYNNIFNGERVNSILLSDPELQLFLGEWLKMLDLYRNGIIDDKLYSLWISDKLESSRIPLTSPNT